MKHWKVLRPGRPSLTVDADYFTIDHGHLCFRCHVRGNYPATVHVIAPDYWSEVTEDKP